MQASCSKNIQKGCSNLLYDKKDENSDFDDFFEGQVVSCLQEIFLKNEHELYPECKRELTSVLRRTALDYKASPSVLRQCKHSIEICKKKTGDSDGSKDDFEDGGVIEGKNDKCHLTISLNKYQTDNKMSVPFSFFFFFKR